jgi:hypothetical protein
VIALAAITIINFPACPAGGELYILNVLIQNYPDRYRDKIQNK